mgnify:FL=1|jgi:GNAT superfamily N-acetyltransferase|tara:strand:+ start:84 stop:527 length:444 start_codon:yes stop_codon:yes gene_type:complete
MIRDATMEDLPRLMAMSETFLLQTQYHHILPYNLDSLMGLMTGLIEKEEGLLLVSDREGVDGMIGMYLYQHPISGETVAGEAFWWMSPERRGGPQALRLLRRAEAWVKSHGVPWFHMVSPNDRVSKLYTRLGYQPLEMHFYRMAENV